MRRYALLVIAWTLMAGGCAFSYVPPVHQGNYLSPAMLHSLKIGMTQGQVVYLLGTPTLKNPFSRTDWYYVFYRKASHLSRSHLIRVEIRFHKGRIVRIIRQPGHALS